MSDTDADADAEARQRATDDDHVVISAHSATRTPSGGNQFYHTAVFDGESFTTPCGADKRMKLPVLVRRADLRVQTSSGDGMQVFGRGYWPCSQCQPRPIDWANSDGDPDGDGDD